MPFSSASASTKGLNDEPAGLLPWVARSNLAWGPPPKKSRHRGLGLGLGGQVEGGLDAQAALEQQLAALARRVAEALVVEDEALDPLHEVRRRVALARRRAGGQHRLGRGGAPVGLTDQPLLGHLLEHELAAGQRRVGVVVGVGGAGRPDEARQQRALRQRELVHRRREVRVGRGLHAVGPVPEVDGVEVELEDPLLRVLVLQLVGQAGLVDLAADVSVVAHQLVLHVLLGDGRAALHHLALAGVGVGGPHDRLGVHALVLPEAGVLDGHDGVAQRLGHHRDGHALAVLLGVQCGDERAVGGVDAGRLGQRRGVERERLGRPRARGRQQRQGAQQGGQPTHPSIVPRPAPGLVAITVVGMKGRAVAHVARLASSRAALRELTLRGLSTKSILKRHLGNPGAHHDEERDRK
jgi:hypothetical protein